MRREGLSQAELASRAKVSQSTVSRALSGAPMRHGAARTRLFSYLGLVDVQRRHPAKADSDELLAAYERVVARSNTLAKAVVMVVSGLVNSDR